MSISACPPMRAAKLPPVRIVLLLALLAFSAASCAKIGEPLPPEVRIPQSATDVTARQVSDSVVLTFSKPARNTTGTEATMLRRVDVLRLRETAEAAAVPDDQFIQNAVRVASIPSSRFSEYLRDQTFIVQDGMLAGESEIYSSEWNLQLLDT